MIGRTFNSRLIIIHITPDPYHQLETKEGTSFNYVLQENVVTTR